MSRLNKSDVVSFCLICLFYWKDFISLWYFFGKWVFQQCLQNKYLWTMNWKENSFIINKSHTVKHREGAKYTCLRISSFDLWIGWDKGLLNLRKKNLYKAFAYKLLIKVIVLRPVWLVLNLSLFLTVIIMVMNSWLSCPDKKSLLIFIIIFLFWILRSPNILLKMILSYFLIRT